ncbi:MAG: GNAT family N-acetyltransferase [Clostridiales bacterium]|nr:GNAT family N-acetyltransferase [Clostridiales bacterium]
MIIREMEKSDLEKCLVLWKDAFNAGYSDRFDTVNSLEAYLDRNPGFSTVVYDLEDNLLGALMCGHDGRRGSIYHTAVSKSHRGKGIGRMMETRSLSKLKKIGITTGFLFINTKNPGSREFWEHTGWEIVDDVKYMYKSFR